MNVNSFRSSGPIKLNQYHNFQFESSAELISYYSLIQKSKANTSNEIK